MEKNLGVIEQTLGAIFGLRYGNFWSFDVHMVWVSWGTKLWVLSVFNTFYVYYNVSIMKVSVIPSVTLTETRVFSQILDTGLLVSDV